MSVPGINIYRKLSVPKKATIWYFSGMVVQRLPHLILIPLLTRLLTQEQYGLITVYQAWLSVFWIVAVLGVREGINVAISEFEATRDQLISSVMSLATLIVLGFAVAFALFSQSLPVMLGMPFYLVMVMLLDVWAFNISDIWLRKQRYLYKYKSTFTFCAVCALLQVCVPVVAVLNSPVGFASSAKIISSAACAVIAAAIIFIVSLSKGKMVFLGKYWKYSLALGMPLIANAVSNAVLNASDRIMISRICGEDKAALYSVPYQISWAFLIIFNSINAAFIPFQYENFKSDRYSASQKPATLLLITGFGMVWAVCLAAPEILTVIAPAGYRQAVYVFPPALSALFFQLLYLFMSNVEYYFKAVWRISAATVCAAALNIALNFFLLPKFGFVAASYTTLVSYILLALFHAINMQAVCRAKGVSETIYNKRWFFLLSILAIVLPLLSSFIFDYAVLRYALLGTLVTAVIIAIKRGVFK